MSDFYRNDRTRRDQSGGKNPQWNGAARSGGFAGKGNGEVKRSQTPAEVKPEKLPADYVELAEQVMRSLIDERNGRIAISTSKIRNLLSMVSEIYNEENLRREEMLHPDSVSRLMLVRMRMVYEYGRNETGVQRFMQKAKLLEYLKGIDSRETLIQFAHYMEALVAYHRYFGGSEG